MIIFLTLILLAGIIVNALSVFHINRTTRRLELHLQNEIETNISIHKIMLKQIQHLREKLADDRRT